MLATYRSGGIAMVLDYSTSPCGSGSWMDPRGRCLMTISGEGRAMVVDESGGIQECFEYSARELLSPPSAAANDVHSEGLSKTLMDARVSSRELRWSYEGISMYFDLAKWEVRSECSV